MLICIHMYVLVYKSKKLCLHIQFIHIYDIHFTFIYIIRTRIKVNMIIQVHS